MEKLLTFLRKLGPLSAEATDAIAAISRPVNISRYKNLQQIGQTCQTIYFLEQGIARIYYYKNDIDITEGFYFEQSIIVRAESLFTGKPSRKAIQVLEDSVLTAIDSSKFFALFNTYPPIERIFRKIIETAYVETINRMESIQFNTAEERYQSLIKSNPHLLKKVPLKYIASYLGITQVSLSRIRANQ
ncbi:Crp/Fnr family transcriptional regulator [Flavihumibacter sp. CACIAM 22H1]|uniref:Crp/Fnr family transcriptional regulator n=1 Tax=Flavihumibacter sp. CACIAM 22H1 TaxID=1812911 RepID=UPI0007A9300F|nr:Crp/Fnr family transcriptional regulator [Flavihumibacter sp. CACIAM 22H1]KYP16666.1 MAG: cyclic nucleotide-binding protein [Flavihumibacter sp. CACIAM 22H1]